ncbi:OmpW/AlkL family protein [Sphingomonas lenta]|uniref:OmpW/AlkL family protein n=1 Tax=Sphingomonas lenta TaxID=1141887 RepID=UPI001FE5E0D9|nr:OmpW family outer membrane protein [Sphingomonas lenta]
MIAVVTVATPAAAQRQDGRIQVKAFATGVLPDGGIDKVKTDAIGLPVGAEVRATDALVPTIAAEYFLTPNFSIETICCVTRHDVRGTGALAGARLIDDAVILPATVTAKFHFQLGERIKPYVGAGPSYFFIFGEDVGPDAAGLGVSRVDLSDELGFALQAGVDVKLNDRGLGLSLDAKRYFVGTTATFRRGQGTALRTDHDLDPWVLSAGLAFRF